jgi:formylmethanofuran dehydrogenase subunit B
MPRLPERVLEVRERLHARPDATVVVLDDGPDAGAAGVERIPVGPAQLADFVQTLRARVAGRPIDADRYPAAAALAERLRGARFPVVAFTPDCLGARHPDLVMRGLAGLVRTLNQQGRAALLPLGEGEGEVTAHQASTWHSGFGVGTSYHEGVPRHDPLLWSWSRVLAHCEADLLVWVSTLSAEAPPATGVPTVVLGHPATRLERAPEVFVPLAVPGVHRRGVLHRGDGVALLPLRALRASRLPHGGEVLRRLHARIAKETA